MKRSPMARGTSTLARTGFSFPAKAAMPSRKPMKKGRAKSRTHTKAESTYLGAVAERGCELCRWLGLGATPCEVHHQRTGTGAGQRADHYHTTGLCYEHHRGATGVHSMGRDQFAEKYGITEVTLVHRTRDALAHLIPLTI